MLEEWLNKREVNYSVVHYKTMVRVHIYFSAIKKMGFLNAVELYKLSEGETDTAKLLGRAGWSEKDIKNYVRQYFKENNLEIKE